MPDHSEFVRSENIKHLLGLIEKERDPERKRWLEVRLEEERSGIIDATDRRAGGTGR